MSIVNLPPFYGMRWSDENGNLTTDASLYSDEMNQTLISTVRLINLISAARIINDGTQNRGTVVNDALIAPSKTSVQITALGADTAIPLGAIFFDTDVAKLKVKTAASTIETITSS